MKSRKIWYTALFVIGAILYILSEMMNKLEGFWGGMGLGFVILSAIRLGQLLRYKHNEAYAKKIKIAQNDERNHFLMNKSRSTAFYLSILLEAIISLVLYIIGQEQIAQVILMVVCGQVLVYWLSYLVLRKKY